MKSWKKPLCFLCVLCGASCCFSLDREAFSITNYDLNLQIEPEQHRLGARGKITLRNDTTAPQKIAVLQISSSLDWRAIRAGDKMLQFVTQPYTSDIDHTGSLSEAIVTLPEEIAPHVTIELEIAYEGVIVLDATRLTRIGTPEDAAKSSDWDRIDENFTGLRGAGYVAWYPIATESASLSDGSDLFGALARWRAKEVGARVKISISASGKAPLPVITFIGIDAKCQLGEGQSGESYETSIDCAPGTLDLDPLFFVIADYLPVNTTSARVDYLAGHQRSAGVYGEAADQLAPLIAEWFGKPKERIRIADLPDPNATPFEIRWLLFAPLATADKKMAGLAAAHQLAHASFLSWRPWVGEGTAHFAQALAVEHEGGRQAAIDYMGNHRPTLVAVEKTSGALSAEGEAARSLVNTTRDELYRSKAMCVWWMLRDMIGDAALKKAIASYKPEQDNDPTYMPRLIAAQTQRDLGWFFDDWLYHDRGLPDFKVESAFAAATPTKSFLLTITLANLGTAGAEVPVIIKFAGGEITKRIELRAKSKATFRVETPAAPQEIRVNDGSVPESDSTNNVFKITTPAK